MTRLLAVAGLVAICGGVSASAVAQIPPRVAGGNGEQRSVLLTSLRLLKAEGVSVTIGHLTLGGSMPDEVDLSFEGRDDAESQWKDEIAAGVFAAHGFRLTWFDIPGRGGARIYPLTRPLAGASATQLLGTIRNAAGRARVKVESVQFLRPMGYAPVITIEVPRPTAFQRSGGLDLSSLVGDHPRIEGFFLICRTQLGRVYAGGGMAFRVGAGAGFIPGSVHG